MFKLLSYYKFETNNYNNNLIKNIKICKLSYNNKFINIKFINCDYINKMNIDKKII
jgi:hypothetical protein